jgi:drug/metabolite transporter (DMT)-like permease
VKHRTRVPARAIPLSSPATPVLAAVAGIGLLSVMDAAVKQVAALGIPTWQIVLLRYAFGTAFALPLFLAGRHRLPPAETLRAHALRAVAVVCTAASFFYALSALPLVVALALSFTAPIMIALLARLSLGERPSAGVLAAIAVGFLGVLTVLAGELHRSGTGTLPGVAAALAAAAFYAVAMVSLKARAARDPVATIVLLQNAFATLLVAPLGAAATWTPASAPILAWFALIGLLGTAGHVALAWAYGRAEASRLGAVEYTAFVWATALGFVFFAEVPSPATLAGAALIMAGAVVAARARPVGEPASGV